MRVLYLLCVLLLATLLSSTQARYCFIRNRARVITINPPTLFDPTPFGFSHISVDTLNAVATVAGQAAIDKNGAVVGTTLAEQLLETEKALNFILQALKADVEDIFKVNVYIVNLNPSTDLPVYQPTGVRLGRKPGVLLSVPRLAFDGLLVEIEIAVAVSKKFVRDIACRQPKMH